MLMISSKMVITSLRLKVALVFSSMASVLLIMGCSPTITSEAQNVVVHSQVSNLLGGCERLGVVSAKRRSRGSLSSPSLTQAKNDIRHEAYVKYGADTVAIVNIDDYGTSTLVEALALKCNK